jgi:phosphoenolpyruvate carboxylase
MTSDITKLRRVTGQHLTPPAWSSHVLDQRATCIRPISDCGQPVIETTRVSNDPEPREELGEHQLAKSLPWINQAKIDLAPNPRLCQAYSIAFQLLNMVEENVAAQVRRARESDTGLAGEPGLWAHHLRQLRESSISESLIAAQLNEIRVEPVLTAHPTEAKRLAVLEQHRALYGSMIRRENQMWTPQEQAAHSG